MTVDCGMDEIVIASTATSKGTIITVCSLWLSQFG